MKSKTFISISLLGLSMVGGAHAGSVGSTLAVSATVVPLCSVSTSPVQFGTYSGATIAANGVIYVTCTDLLPFNIALDGGASYMPGQRRMSDGDSSYLNYELFMNPELTNPWGDIGYGDTTPWISVSGSGNGGQTGYAVYGQVLAFQDTPAGAYSDVVNVTIHY